MRQCWRARLGGEEVKLTDLTNTATAKAQNQDCELAHPNIHLVYELLACMKGPGLRSKGIGPP